MDKKKIVAFSIFGVLALIIVSVGIFGKDLVFSIKSSNKTYEALGFSFESDEYLYEVTQEGFGIAFEGLFNNVAVLGNHDSKKHLLELGYEEIDLDSYAHLAHESNDKNPTELIKSSSGKYYYYTYEAGDEKEEYFYLCTIYESDKYFWLVNFASKKDEQDKYKNKFLKWADTVVIKNS